MGPQGQTTQEATVEQTVYDLVGPLREGQYPLVKIRAAELLGLNRNTLRKKIRELQIDVVRGSK